ncbi:hypothetical protein E2C01_011606 [Portunus trituberculatus]|uniref:Uncharacterized protein n=1 Tax=Portunus trituberculatus TaxID=210409 RepID=A0A5B7DBK9_PORTR|nr:hypothetical protein [Portunus trituberculatus]
MNYWVAETRLCEARCPLQVTELPRELSHPSTAFIPHQEPRQPPPRSPPSSRRMCPISPAPPSPPPLQGWNSSLSNALIYCNMHHHHKT